MHIPVVDKNSLIFTNIIETIQVMMIVTLQAIWRRLGRATVTISTGVRVPRRSLARES